MSRDITLDCFVEIEEKYNLYEDTIEDVNYWIYSRFIIWEDIIAKTSLGLGEAHSSKKLKLIDKAVISAKLLKKSLFNFKRFKKNIDILFVPHPRRILRDGYYECIYTDELAKQFTDYAALEQPYQWTHLEPIATDNLIYADYILLKKGAYFMAYKLLLRKKYGNLLERIESKISKPLAELEKAYELQLDIKLISRCIAKQILAYKGSAKSTRKLLKRLNPGIVVEVVGYNPFCMLLNEICKEKKIPTIELQHGTMNGHIAYKYEVEHEIKQFPDKLFLFSEYWKGQIHVPIRDEELIVTGYPYFERKLNEVRAIEEYDDGKINILFISQGTIGKKLSELAYATAEILNAENYRVFYKLHPGELAIWEKEYTDLTKGNLTVISDNRYSLYEYFATCQIQVGVYSTALYEGLGFGLETFIYQIENADRMSSLREKGYAKYIRDVKELYEHIHLCDSQKKEGEEFWEKDAMKKMVMNIRKLL